MTTRSYVVVGGGIVGLAVARRLLEVYPGVAVTVAEKEPRVALHQSGHNSGVVHAGVYYAPGSLKALLCRQGRELLRAACQEWDLPYMECGKLIVARNGSELPALLDLENRALANRVPCIGRLGPEAIAEIEPHVAGVAALYSPKTAIVDFQRVANSMADDVIARGGQLRLGAKVNGFRFRANAVEVLTAEGETFTADTAVLCAGLQSDRVARLAGDVAGPGIIPFRGEYYRIAASRADLVRGLIYPVPDPRYPFLGVHFTRRVDGSVDVGPNAVIALARERYSKSALNLSDVSDVLRWPGFWRLARQHWSMGAREMRTSLSKSAFTKAAQVYVPDLRVADLAPAPAGIRAQAVARDGSLVDDFEVHFLGRVVAVRNAPSPAATSSLAIARHLVECLAESNAG